MISIHAPVKGATLYEDLAEVVNVISIHAPVKGATRFVQVAFKLRRISIHAPVKGATCRNTAASARQ